MLSEELPCDDCGLTGEDCECCVCEDCFEVLPEVEERPNGQVLCDRCWKDQHNESPGN